MTVKMQLYNGDDNPALLAELRAEIESHEQRYGIKSEDLQAALTDGSIEETFEICSWWIAYQFWLAVRGEQRCPTIK